MASGCVQLIGHMGIARRGSGVPQLPFDELAKLFNVPLLSVDKGWIDGTHAEYRMKVVKKGE